MFESYHRNTDDTGRDETNAAGRFWATFGVATALFLILLPIRGWADGDTDALPTWTTWETTWPISGLIAAFTLVYAAGMKSSPNTSAWRHVAYFGGLLVIFLALQSPLDPLSDHVYAIHQVTHMMLMLGPMLIALSAPQAVLVRGSPDSLKRFLVKPLIDNAGVGALFHFLTRPSVALALFIATPSIWQIPALHDLALLNDPVHYTMHATLLLASLIFWWRVYDVRLPPLGTAYGTRLGMAWAAILSNFALGVFLSFKPEVLYPTYTTLGRLWGLAPLTDENLGGLTIWIPRTMMLSLGTLALMYRWGAAEARARIATQRRQTPPNKILIFILLGFSCFIFCAVFVVALIVRSLR